MTSNPSIEKTFDTFSPKEYLEEYYSNMGQEEINLLSFFIYAYSFIPKKSLILEFGGGPTIYQLISAATHAREIYFADYIEFNLVEVKNWMNEAKGAFNWDLYFKKVLQLEGKRADLEKIRERADLLRTKIARFMHCDAFDKNPLGEKYKGFFDVVSVNFVPESISKNKNQWKNAINNICSLIKPGGFLIMTALEGANYWHSGKKKFPAANIDTKDVKGVLIDMGFKKKSLKITTSPAETLNDKGEGAQGFRGVIYVLAQKQSILNT